MKVTLNLSELAFMMFKLLDELRLGKSVKEQGIETADLLDLGELLLDNDAAPPDDDDVNDLDADGNIEGAESAIPLKRCTTNVSTVKCTQKLFTYCA